MALVVRIPAARLLPILRLRQIAGLVKLCCGILSKMNGRSGPDRLNIGQGSTDCSLSRAANQVGPRCICIKLWQVQVRQMRNAIHWAAYCSLNWVCMQNVEIAPHRLP